MKGPPGEDGRGPNSTSSRIARPEWDMMRRAIEILGEGRNGVEVTTEGSFASPAAVDVLRRLGALVARRDPRTWSHSMRIGRYSARLALLAGLPAEEAGAIGLAAPLHDVGKLAVPDAILLKRGPLDHVERALIEGHAEVGHRLLVGTGLPLLDLAAEIALTHHERFDGSGYPRRLTGVEIPIAGRIVAITDSFDSRATDRPYQRALPRDRAALGLLADGGAHFDPRLLELFIANVKDVIGAGDPDPES